MRDQETESYVIFESATGRILQLFDHNPRKPLPSLTGKGMAKISSSEKSAISRGFNLKDSSIDRWKVEASKIVEVSDIRKVVNIEFSQAKYTTDRAVEITFKSKDFRGTIEFEISSIKESRFYRTSISVGLNKVTLGKHLSGKYVFNNLEKDRVLAGGSLTSFSVFEDI